MKFKQLKIKHELRGSTFNQELRGSTMRAIALQVQTKYEHAALPWQCTKYAFNDVAT